MPVGNIIISRHQNSCSDNTICATASTTNTCHHERPKTTTTVAAISRDDSSSTCTETVLQVPTRTTHQQQEHNLRHCSSLRVRPTTSSDEQKEEVASHPMTGSQAALISPEKRGDSAPVAQVPQSRTFPRRKEDSGEIVLFEDEYYYGRPDLDLSTLEHSSTSSALQQNSVNMSVLQQNQQSRRNPVIGLSGSQPSLSGTLAAFVTGNHSHHNHHFQQQPSGKDCIDRCLLWFVDCL